MFESNQVEIERTLHTPKIANGFPVSWGLDSVHSRVNAAITQHDRHVHFSIALHTYSVSLSKQARPPPFKTHNHQPSSSKFALHDCTPAGMRDMELHKVGSKGGIRFTAIHPNSVWIDFNGHVVFVLRKVSQINGISAISK